MKTACLLAVAFLLCLYGVAYSDDLGTGYMGCNCPRPTQPLLSNSVQSLSNAAQPQVSGTLLYGVDVSYYQGSIDWTTLKTVKSFAIMKATEGKGYTDSTFSANRSGSRSVGILRGFYHFCRPDLGNTAVAEADYFLGVVGTLQAGEVLMCDYEPKSNPADPVGWCLAWLNECYAKTSIKPLIYLNQSQINSWNWSSVINAGYGLVLADPDGIADPSSPLLKWPFNTMKQYSWTGTVSGIPAAVDMDVFNGNSDQFIAYGTGPLPTITTQPQPQTICSGYTVTFTVSATTTTGSLTYQWRLNGSNISGATSTSYTTGTAGSYDCVVSNPFGSRASNAAVLTVTAAPKITTQPTYQTVPFGSTGTFTVAASGTSLAYQWRRNRTIIPGANSTSYTTGNPGGYDCVVTGGCGSVTSSVAGLLFGNTTPAATVAEAKQLADGVIVALSAGPVVTRAFDSIFYVEDTNEVAGLRVIPSPSNMLTENSLAIIYGTLQTVAGERAITNALVNRVGSTTAPPSTVGMTCGSAVLPLAQGLSVRMCGVATVAQGATNTFTLNDGSNSTITVQLYGVAMPANGAYVTVRGVLGQESFGTVLRVNKSSDLW